MLFADEPVTALDYDCSRVVLEDLKKISSSNVAVVAALHQLDLALDWATDLLVLANGRVVASGPSQNFSLEQLEELIVESRQS